MAVNRRDGDEGERHEAVDDGVEDVWCQSGQPYGVFTPGAGSLRALGTVAPAPELDRSLRPARLTLKEIRRRHEHGRVKAIAEELGERARDDDRARALVLPALAVLALPAASLAPLGLDHIKLRRELGEQVRAEAVVRARVEGELPDCGRGAGEEDVGHGGGCVRETGGEERGCL